MRADVYVGIVNIDDLIKTSSTWSLKVKQKDFMIHESYFLQTVINDIALIYSASKIPENKHVTYCKSSNKS